ncbi:MAG TPA: fibronectin type III domain-containing protein, partial [Planctomycetota bacterium]|nr:fibronectin type III domain-containing protein [Planctomycetota bacterium]
MEKKNCSITRIGLTSILVIFLLLFSSLTWAQDNTQTKTENGSTVTIAGPLTALPNTNYDIVLRAFTDVSIFQWSLTENGVSIAGSGFTFGSQFNQTYTFNRPVGSYTYLFSFRGVGGAHGWPAYTTVSITINVVAPSALWAYRITGPDDSTTVEANTNQVVYFELDAIAPDYVWGNILALYDTSKLQAVSIEEDPNNWYGFYTWWTTATGNPAYNGGGDYYYYDRIGNTPILGASLALAGLADPIFGLGSAWAQQWVAWYGDGHAGPVGTIDPTYGLMLNDADKQALAERLVIPVFEVENLGAIRSYVSTYAGRQYGASKLRLGYRVLAFGTASFHTLADGSPDNPIRYDWNHHNLDSYLRSDVELVPLLQPPAAPSNLVATAVSSSQIDLTWDNNATNADGIIIEGKVNCFSDFVQLAKVGANTTTYSDKRALAGITHFYRVKAYNETGDSAYSNIASATTPTPMNDILSALARLYQEGAIKNAGLYNSLLVKLQAAQNAQNFNAAINQLNAFANQVQAQTGKGITTNASPSLLALNTIAIAYINPDKIASGWALISTFKPIDYPAVRIEARETPEPYVPYGGADNRAYIFEATPGVLNLYYYDGVGQCVNIKRNIEINNITRVIYFNGAPVTTLREIFGELLPIPAGDYMYLTMDFPYWLTIFMTPVSHLQTQAYMDDFTTDKGRPVETMPDGYPWPPPAGVPVPPWYTEDVARDMTITEVNNTSINGHSIGALISMGVITSTAIPTDSYNCWGWTFTCGSGWMDDPIDVDNVLSDNGYTQIPPTASAPAQPGDVIVYRDAQGNVLHTGIVREVDPATGQPTLVESKWGRKG